MKQFKRILVLILVFTSVLSYAQVGSKRCKWVVVRSGDFELDSLSVFPNSIQLNFPSDSTVKLLYDLTTNKATLSSTVTIDSIHVCYTVLPYKLSRPYYNRDIAIYDSNAVYKEDYSYRRYLPDKKEELFSSPGINKTGNISRGISFGNNQNVFVNSVLNLQLEGKLTDDVSIAAVISDQNIPFQPDGNTQQIQEFDKVYIQLKSKRASLIAGDLVMKSRSSSFLNYYRNVQGAQLEVNTINKDSTIKSSTTAGVAVSKGKFNSIQFGYGLPDSLSEGVQGPYRLRGPNGERFIIILANSEKVYLDGVLLKRGWDYDYVIDYNQAELTFTNNVLVTRFSRVRVDFEYSERNYGRTIFNFSHYQDYKNVHGFVNYYMEGDNPNNPLLIELTEQDKQYLSGIGDTLNRAVVSGIDSVKFTENSNLYRKVIVGGVTYYEYSVNPDSAYFDIRFTEVALGSGSYVLDNALLNGRIYRYVGYPNGNFEPVQVIVTPKKKQMITVGGSVDVSNSEAFYGEAAFSLNDINLYSAEDSQDDNGYAYKIGYMNRGKPISFFKNYKWISGVDYEFNDKYFEAIDRFRTTDFERNWNENMALKTENNIFNASAGIVKNELNKINYAYTRREKPSDVSGNQHTIQFSQSLKRFQLISTGFLMNSQGKLERADWQRLNSNLYYTSRYFVPGYVISFDHNIVSDTDGVARRTSMYFDEQKVYVRSNDTSNLRYLLDYAVRKDKEVFAGVIEDNSRTETTNFSLGGRIGENHTVNTIVTYRFQDNEIGPTRSLSEETVMGRGEWNADFLKKHLRSELLLSSATGRELKRQFAYISVAPGLGTHVWNDFNGDGKQQLNEFLEKIFDDPDGEYIKTFIPTDQYVKAYTNVFNYRLDASAPRNWRTSKRALKRFVSKFSNVSSVSTNKKLLDKSIASRFIPFYTDIADSNLISYVNSLRSTLFFNRTNPAYGVELNFSNTESKQYLIQGFDSRRNNEVGLMNRVNIKKKYNLKIQGIRTLRSSKSNYLINRNYEIEGWRISPSFSIQPKNSFRLTTLFAYIAKMNVLEGSLGELSHTYETGLEVKANKLSRRTITLNFKFINIWADLKSGPANSPIAYEMFEALQLGKNFTWSAVWQEKLISGLQLSFNYEGRKMGDTPRIIHIGRMQVSALF